MDNYYIVQKAYATFLEVNTELNTSQLTMLLIAI